MPAYAHIEPVLNGRGSLYRYEGKDKWYYRQWIPDAKKYVNRIIKGVETLEEARNGVIDVAFQVQGELEALSEQVGPTNNKGKRVSTPRGNTIQKEVDLYLEGVRKKVESGQLEEGTYTSSKLCLNYLIQYLNSLKINKASQITADTFTDYPLYRKGYSKLTIKKELVIFKQFITNHLHKQNLVSGEVAWDKDLTPKIKIRQDELVANPSITASDWMKINKEIRDWAKKDDFPERPNVRLWRVTYWTFTMVMKNSGLRPNEMWRLKWKHVEHENIGRINSKGEKVDEWVSHLYVARSKTARSRLVPTNKNVTRRLTYLRSFIDSYLYKRGLDRKCEPNDLVFGKPDKEFKARSESNYGRAWRDNLKRLKGQLEGNRFSDRNYTQYSMRSTFIENQLANGVDIYLVARACGHDVSVLQRHYDRMDIQRRARELTHIPYKKKDE